MLTIQGINWRMRMQNKEEQSKLNKLNGISDSEYETLIGIFIQAPNLRKNDIGFLLNNGFVYSECSDYGYKLSDKGFAAIDEPF
jgi:hypothetical protein